MISGDTIKEDFIISWKRTFILRLVFTILIASLIIFNYFLKESLLALYPILVLTVIFLSYNIIFHFIVTKVKITNYLPVIFTIALIDGLVATAYIHFSGGHLSFGFVLYVFIIFYFSSFMYASFLYALASILFLFYTLTILSDYFNVLPRYNFGHQYSPTSLYTASIILHKLIVVLILLFVFAFYSKKFIDNILVERKRAKALQEGTIHLTKAIGKKEEILSSLLKTALEVTNADSATILEHKDNQWKFISWEGISDELVQEIEEKINTAIPLNLEIIKNNKESIYYPDTNKIPHWYKSIAVRSYIGCPIIVNDEVIAILNIDSKLPNKFNSGDRRIVESLGRLVTEVIERNIAFEREEGLRKKAEEASITDYLTGLFNRRELERVLRQEIVRALRYSRKFQFIIIDVNNFKKVNDTLGHPEGDKVLKTFSQLLLESTRKPDLVFRFGGDEFVVILLDSPFSAITMVIDRFRSNFESVFKDYIMSLKLGFSYGYLSFPEDLEETIREGDYKESLVDTLFDEIFIKTDEFLYRNKEKKEGTLF